MATNHGSTYGQGFPSRSLLAVVMAGLAVAALEPAAARAELMEEAHVFHVEVAEPAWDTEYEGTLEIPRFDTMGGTRQLLGYRADYDLSLAHTVVVNDNVEAYQVGSEGLWSATWQGAGGDGYVLFPATWEPPQLHLGGGFGAVVDPLQPGVVFEDEVRGLEYEETVTDPVNLGILTGTGILECQSDLALSAVDYHQVPGEEEPIPWAPSLVEIIPEHLALDFTLTYVYTPEPSTLALLLGSAAMLLSRRRR